MAKKKPPPKKKPEGPSDSDRIEDLVELAHKLSLPDDAFDGDLRDAADEEADLIYENVKSEGLYQQLEFLYSHGFQLGRLEELIRELSAGQ